MLHQERPKPKYAQTIEELLGLPAKSDVTNGSVNSTTDRPSTRHGRRDSLTNGLKDCNQDTHKLKTHALETWTAIDKQDSEHETNLERIESNRSLVPIIKKSIEMHAEHRNRRGSLTTASSPGSSASTGTKKVTLCVVDANGEENCSAELQAVQSSTAPSTDQKKQQKNLQRQKSLPPSRISTFVDCNVSSTAKNTHQAWLDAKIREKRKLEQERKEKKEQEKQKQQERKEEAKRSFDIWKQKQDEKLKEAIRKQKQAEEEKRRKEKEDKLRKHEESGKVFEAWKRERSISFSHEKMKLEKRKREEALKKDRNDQTRQLESEDAVDTWLERKRMQEDSQRRHTFSKLLEKERQEQDQRDLKEALASEAYTMWLDMKDREKEFSQTLANRILTYEEEAKKRWPTPWLPPSNTVPRHFVSSGSRKKSLDPRKPLRHSRPSTRAPRSASVH